MNLHHHRAALEAHLDGRVHRSVEADEPLGTAGALGHLRAWIDGRAVLVVNADAWCPGTAGAARSTAGTASASALLVAGERPAASRRARVAGALLPWSDVARAGAGALRALRGVVAAPRSTRAASRSCATTARSSTAARRRDYLRGQPARPAAARAWSADGAVVEGKLDRCRRVARRASSGRGARSSTRSATTASAPSSCAVAERGPRRRRRSPPARAWSARSWPQAASMSVPRVRRTVALTPPATQPVAERPHPPRRASPARRSRASGSAG